MTSASQKYCKSIFVTSNRRDPDMYEWIGADFLCFLESLSCRNNGNGLKMGATSPLSVSLGPATVYDRVKFIYFSWRRREREPPPKMMWSDIYGAVSKISNVSWQNCQHGAMQIFEYILSIFFCSRAHVLCAWAKPSVRVLRRGSALEF